MLEFESIRAWPGENFDVTYTDRDSLLYALSTGLGGPDPRELPYVYERDQLTAPTLAMLVGHALPWMRLKEHRISTRGMLHGESAIQIARPLPASGTVTVQSRIDRVVDRGPQKGAAIYFSNSVVAKASGEAHGTVSGCFLFPREGGPGDSDSAVPRPEPIPEREPDASFDQLLPVNAAQLYRLTGDRNPLHVDPLAAKQAGQEQPILHGLCTFGFVAGALLRTRAEFDARRFRKLAVRYAAPVYPGETLRTEIFDLSDGRYAFRCLSVERGKVVVNNGVAIIEDRK